MLKELWQGLGGAETELDVVDVIGVGSLESAFPVTDLACASIGAAALSIAELLNRTLGIRPRIDVDRRLSSYWFQFSIRPVGWNLPAAWDAIAGDYVASDGWIRLHTNAPHHRQAVEQVLGAGNREEVATEVAKWNKRDLEAAIVASNGCAAEMRSIEEWRRHPQGMAVANDPLVETTQVRTCAPLGWVPSPERPLAGIKVLDLTRVLAGPVATRFLAGYGADVLRIDPPDWDEPGVVPEVTLGKRCARLDLQTSEHRALFETLLSEADILIHGYRPGALDGLGYDAKTRHSIAPNLIDVTLNAYGWHGPWASRRGFDSLVQMSIGIASRGMKWKGAAKPVPLPAQALDQTTGYLIAATAIRALTTRLEQQVATTARLSLARTATELISRQKDGTDPLLEPESPDDQSSTVEQTAWGPARRLKPPVGIEGAPMHWEYPSGNLGASLPSWIR